MPAQVGTRRFARRDFHDETSTQASAPAEALLIRTLHHDDFDAVFTAFREAFSDYVVPLSLTREQLQEMLTRRGWAPHLSAGVFDGARMVAFTLNGFEDRSAYDSGTGVVPSHRHRGLGREMIGFVLPLLRDAGAERYVLEVIDSNAPAIAIYRAAGFQETRKLQSWIYDADAPSAEPIARGAMHPEYCDVAPSWQNSTASIRRARDRFEVIGNDDGYAVVFPSNGDLPQLAVRPEARRRGLGTRLLREAAAIAGKPLRILNIDDRASDIAAFLEAAGARRIVRQLEMELRL
jgi:ribosomal protein S18 acetylase RimI-like enzyme